ncbi:MAG: trehalose-6-phosphate synthase [Acidimicrobiales bacterium]|nr:trehalose-6-phosphate synthase [Acidimicrobiales bacterium]
MSSPEGHQPSPGGDRPLVVVSNRGPVSFSLVDDEPVVRRGAGGLASGLGPLVRGTGALWVAAAMTDGDRATAARGVVPADGFDVRLLDIDARTWSLHYDSVCNEALWFAHHGLFDSVYSPTWPPGWVDSAWDAYRRVNVAFAEAVAGDAPRDAVVLIQDYHLCLMAEPLRRARPDLALVHFSHTPFATPAWLRMLPDVVRTELVDGLAAHHAVGFHTGRWVADFEACCADLGIRPPATFASPLAPDPDDLRATVESAACQEAGRELDEIIGDRAFVARVDRIELSKNILRGFDAFAALLEADPSRHGKVVFGAFCYPSRQGVADYDRYATAVASRVGEINERFGTSDWTPIHYDPTDHYPRSVAALVRADVVVVNPVRDGLNLVAKEAVVVNDRDGQLLLSPEAGAWPELATHAWRADPFDVGQTARAMAGALDATPGERRRRADGLRSAATARTSADWLADQLAAAPVR